MRIAPLSFVDFAPVAETNNKNAYGTILNVGDDAVIADPIFPQLPQLGAFQGFAEATGVVERGQAFDQELDDALSGLVALLTAPGTGR